MLDRAVASLTDEAVRNFMNVRLSRYKALDGGIVQVDEIPRSASGKILKPMLRKLAAKEVAEEVFAAGEQSGAGERASTSGYKTTCFIF